MHCSYGLQGSPSNPETSTSGSSSPQSNSSTDEENQVAQEQSEGACATSKPYYNFSIPDLIKRERLPSGLTREENRTVADDPHITSDSCTLSSNDLKRRHSPRDPTVHLSGASLRNVTESEHYNNRSKRRRTSSRNAPIENRPPVIDLTASPEVSEIETIRLFDDQISGAHSDSEVTTSGMEARYVCPQFLSQK